jgi:hypothetical protein
MSEPLTAEQRGTLRWLAADDGYLDECDDLVLKAALARLDFLELKVAAANSLAESVTSDTIRFYDNNESARTMHLREECGSGHCGYCSEARQPYLATGPALAAYNEVMT